MFFSDRGIEKIYSLLYVSDKGMWKFLVSSFPTVNNGYIGVESSIIEPLSILGSNPPMMF